MQTTAYVPELNVDAAGASVERAIASSDWRARLPVLDATGVTLRELQPSDAVSLFGMLANEDVARFVSPPPATVEGFERFIDWTHRERAAGRSVCFGIVPQGQQAAIGLIQARALEPRWGTAEWGFAMGSPYWGSGIFPDSARAVMTFMIEKVGVHRLEARATVSSGRGNGALEKLGAVQEGILRKSFARRGQYFDQVLWSIVEDQSYRTKAIWGSRVH